MAQIYQGHYENGNYILDDGAVMPENTRFSIRILADKVKPKRKKKTAAQQQNEALKRFYKAIDAITDEPLDDEFDAIVNSGFKFNRELDHNKRMSE